MIITIIIGVGAATIAYFGLTWMGSRSRKKSEETLKRFCQKIPLSEERFNKLLAMVKKNLDGASWSCFDVIRIIGQDPNVRFTVDQINVLRNYMYNSSVTITYRSLNEYCQKYNMWSIAQERGENLITFVNNLTDYEYVRQAEAILFAEETSQAVLMAPFDEGDL